MFAAISVTGYQRRDYTPHRIGRNAIARQHLKQLARRATGDCFIYSKENGIVELFVYSGSQKPRSAPHSFPHHSRRTGELKAGRPERRTPERGSRTSRCDLKNQRRNQDDQILPLGE
jgi:hypothetical protein